MARKRKRPEAGRPPRAAAPPTSRPAPDRRRIILGAWLAVTLAALILRLALVPISPKITYPGDHDDFVRWGMQATETGLLTMYEEPPARIPMRVWNEQRQQWGSYQRPVDRVCNYPPGSVYLLWISGVVHDTLGYPWVVNTVASHYIFSIWSIIGDFIVAWGIAAIVGLNRPAAWVRILTYALALFLPPLWWDSVIWAQMDSVVLAPAVWMLYFMLRQRWLMAGILWGVALSLKTQGILFVPLWGLAIFVGRPRWGPWAGGLAALGSLLVISLPFTVTGGWSTHGPDWFNLSYWENLFKTYAIFTTLKAFNLWYLDLLISDSIYSTDTWIGIEKGTWGKIFLLVGLLGGFAFALWRWRKDPRVLLYYAVISLLVFLMLPTNVHERYLIIVLPFLGAAAVLRPRLLPALALLVIVMMAQITWPHWLRSGRGKWREIEQGQVKRYEQFAAQAARNPRAEVPPLEQYLERVRQSYWETRAETAPREWLFTLMALVGMILVLVPLAVVPPEPRPDAARGPPCPSCGHRNAAGAKYCARCGASPRGAAVR